MESVKFIGEVQSTLKEIEECPLQEDEGAPSVAIRIYEAYQTALSGLAAGSSIILFTWLHRANRDTLTTKPRNDPKAKTLGVFATRSPDRPNPIGMHQVKIIKIDGYLITVSQLEVVDGTPLIDIKPVI